jgi:lysophospholipase L1-like esterase
VSAGSQIYPDKRRRAPRHAHLKGRPHLKGRRGRQRNGPAFAVLLVAGALVGALALVGVAESLLGGTPSGPTVPAVALGEPTPAGVEATAGAEVAADAEPATPATPRPGTGALPVGPDACQAPTAARTSGPGTEARPGVLASTAPVKAPIARHQAVFLGDSYTSGYLGIGEGPNGWPAIVSGSAGWRMVNLAEPGIGFVNPGWTTPVRTQVAEAIRLNPDLVVLAAGHNDEHYGTDRTARAADSALSELSAGLPGAVLVVIGPIWYDGSPVPSIVALRDHLRARAGATGALFIDPIAGRWFAGSNHQFIGADGVHPTSAGHRHIARLVLEALRADPRFAPSPDDPATATPVPIDASGNRSGGASATARCAA